MKKFMALTACVCAITLVAKGNIERLGDALQIASPLYAAGLMIWQGDVFSYGGGGSYLLGLVATQASTELLKVAVREKRPDGSDRKSFPSGHTSAAAFGATWIHNRYDWKPALLAYAMTGVVAYSRVHANKHYIHDTIAGVAVAATWTYFLTPKSPNFTLVPSTKGVMLRYCKHF